MGYDQPRWWTGRRCGCDRGVTFVTVVVYVGPGGNPLLSKGMAKESNPGVAQPQVPPSKEENTPSVFPCVPSHNKTRTRQETG